MPDISMCENKDCPLRQSCYRFTATPNDMGQYYDDFRYEMEPLTGTAKCEHYMLDLNTVQNTKFPPQEFRP